MKTYILILFIIAHLGASAQNNTIVKAKEINSSQSIEHIKKSTVIENRVTKTYLVKNEEYYTSFIDALEEKKRFVSNDAILKQKAEEDGWFIKINSEIEKAKIKRSKLISNEK